MGVRARRGSAGLRGGIFMVWGFFLVGGLWLSFYHCGGGVEFFKQFSFLCSLCCFCLFSSLLLLPCGMLNPDERKLFGMSSSHFSFAHLRIGCSN